MKASSSVLIALSFIVTLVTTQGSAFAASTKLEGAVKVDGSSTVYPITEAVAEEFNKAQPKVRVTVGVSGTGGGFKKFAVGETDLSNASRPITKDEQEKAAANKIEFIELPIAYDAITVVTNKATPVDNVTMAELKAIWETGSKIKKWNEANAKWPAVDFRLYGPGSDSGTFDYFTEAVMHKSGNSRADYTQSEDDNVLVTGVAGDKNTLGYFGYSYFLENQSKLKALSVESVAATPATIEDGSYPLARPVFIYVTKKAAERPEVQEFVEFYLDNAPLLAKEVGMVPLKAAVYAAAKKRFKDRVTGTAYTADDMKKLGLNKLYNIVN